MEKEWGPACTGKDEIKLGEGDTDRHPAPSCVIPCLPPPPPPPGTHLHLLVARGGFGVSLSGVGGFGLVARGGLGEADSKTVGTAPSLRRW